MYKNKVNLELEPDVYKEVSEADFLRQAMSIFHNGRNDEMSKHLEILANGVRCLSNHSDLYIHNSGKHFSVKERLDSKDCAFSTFGKKYLIHEKYFKKEALNKYKCSPVASGRYSYLRVSKTLPPLEDLLPL